MGMGHESEMNASMSGGNRWARHLKSYRKKHPSQSLKHAMKAASKTYKKNKQHGGSYLAGQSNNIMPNSAAVGATEGWDSGDGVNTSIDVPNFAQGKGLINSVLTSGGSKHRRKRGRNQHRRSKTRRRRGGGSCGTRGGGSCGTRGGRRRRRRGGRRSHKKQH